MSDVVVGEDGLARCPWGAATDVYRRYHDEEWGRPVQGEAAHYERLTLEAFQSGLSWITILNKRPAFREVFHGFDADEVAAFTDADQARLMQDPRIVRNRLKIAAAVTNARATVALREHGGLEALIRSFARVARAFARALRRRPDSSHHRTRPSGCSTRWSRSASETTPTTRRWLSTTGRALTRCSARAFTISR